MPFTTNSGGANSSSSSSFSSSHHHHHNHHKSSSSSSDLGPEATTSLFSFGVPPSAFALFDGLDLSYLKDRITTLNQLCRQVHMVHVKANDTLQKMSELQKRIKEDEEEEDPVLRQQLADLYRDALRDHDTEVEMERKALEMIFDIRSQAKNRARKMSYGQPGLSIRKGELMKLLQDCGNIIPLFIGKSFKDEPPALCGAKAAEPGYIAKPGDLVAALVKNESPDATGNHSEDNWILAEVVAFEPGTAQYLVDDIDEEQKERHCLPRKKVVPLPTMRANPDTDPDALHPAGTPVLALYPQTTCFYPGIVKDFPSSATAGYQIMFEDSAFPEGYSLPLEVAQRYVIPHKMLKSSKKQKVI